MKIEAKTRLQAAWPFDRAESAPASQEDQATSILRKAWSSLESQSDGWNLATAMDHLNTHAENDHHWVSIAPADRTRLLTEFLKRQGIKK